MLSPHHQARTFAIFYTYPLLGHLTGFPLNSIFSISTAAKYTIKKIYNFIYDLIVYSQNLYKNQLHLTGEKLTDCTVPWHLLCASGSDDNKTLEVQKALSSRSQDLGPNYGTTTY